MAGGQGGIAGYPDKVAKDHPKLAKRALLTILERTDTAGARFRSLTEAIDTSGPAGRMLMQMGGSGTVLTGGDRGLLGWGASSWRHPISV